MAIKKDNPHEWSKPKVRYLVDPKKLSKKDFGRIQAWAHGVMKANEPSLSLQKFKDREVVASGEIKPEDIDVWALYDQPELNWIIYRDGTLWSMMLRTKGRKIATFTFAQI